MYSIIQVITNQPASYLLQNLNKRFLQGAYYRYARRLHHGKETHELV